jgi:folate-binding protein YgfZ
MSIKVVELAAYSLLKISGDERTAFLQGQLTQDLDRVTGQNSALAGWTSAKGRLLMVAQLLAWHESFYLPVPTEIAEDLAQRFRMFVLRAKVEIELSDLALLGLIDLDTANPSNIGALSLDPEAGAQASNEALCVARVVGDLSRAWFMGETDRIRHVIATEKFGRADSPCWDLQNIQNGLPVIQAAISESFVPQMLNLDLIDGISFTKGCYLGQEIVARTQNLGRIKRRMYHFGADAMLAVSAGMNLYGPDNLTGKIVATAPNGSAMDLLAVVPIKESTGHWFADEERTLPVYNRGLPYL